MVSKNRSVPVDTVLPHVNYQNLGEAMAWLTTTQTGRALGDSLLAIASAVTRKAS